MGESLKPANRLIHEKSPYLLQHAHNPVDWYPWGEEAFKQAAAENKAIFLSVGYSTCHWCHVMERESFENPAVAEVMNRHFINIKVDREERPDVDQLYMAFVQATTGQGGWPMSVWLTPDLEPISGGTYFPPSDHYGRPGFTRILEAVAAAWEKEPGRLKMQGKDILGALAGNGGGEEQEPLAAWIEGAYSKFAGSFDPEEAGFGRAPKFPRPVVLQFLMRYGFWKQASAENREMAREMSLKTLRKMAAGGMYDHVGGGFHRYSVDGRWHVPHFEKMLYDQAQLIEVYLDGWQISGDEVLAETARDVVAYVLREMTAPEGAFWSAEDADSLPSKDSSEKKEGAFYVWTMEEVREVLADGEFHAWASLYGVEAAGNVDPSSDPHGELEGQNVLIRGREVQAGEKMLLNAAREKLLKAREVRPRPHLDDKILASWNGLMIAALARAGRVLGEEEWIQKAGRAADFVLKELADGNGGLRRSWRQGVSDVRGFADDYAFMIQGLLALFEATGERLRLSQAESLQREMERRFADQERGGYYRSEAGDPHMPVRMKEDYDGAEPAPHSVAVLNLLRLAAATGGQEWSGRAGSLLRSLGENMSSWGTASPLLLAGLVQWMRGTGQAVFTAGGGSEVLRKEYHRHYRPFDVELKAGEEGKTAGMHPVNGSAALYLCENFTCQAPVTDVAGVEKILEG